MANKLKDTTPRPRIGKTAKDTRVARLIDVNQVVEEVNSELLVIEGEQVIQDMRLAQLEADVAAIPPAPTPPTTSVVNISSAQILAMGSTPIELLPAPGVGKYYDFEKVILEYTHVSTAYTLADLLTLSQASSYLTILSAAIITNSGNRAMVTTKGVGSLDLVNEAALSEISDINTAITLSTYNGVDPTLGDGTLRAIITYTVRTFGA